MCVQQFKCRLKSEVPTGPTLTCYKGGGTTDAFTDVTKFTHRRGAGKLFNVMRFDDNYGLCHLD